MAELLTRDDKFDRIMATINQRRDFDARRIREMIEIRDRYNGDYVVPIPDVEGEDELPAPTPELMADAIDQTAMRAASVMPVLEFPSVTGSGVTHDTARTWARYRRSFAYHVWEESALPLVAYRIFRHLTGYGSNALTVIPDFEQKEPRIVARDPLTAYPEPRDAEDVRPPRNTAFVYGRSVAWLRKQYPEAADVLRRYKEGDASVMWDVFEWIDEDEIIIGLLAPRQPDWVRSGYGAPGDTPDLSMPLRRYPNRAGVCTAYVPFRITLDRVMSQVATMVPVNDLWAKMMALDVVAAEKAIFTDRYAVGTEQGQPEIVSGGGNWQDGRTGKINLLRNVAQVGAMQDGPGPAAQPVIDRLERTVRIGSGAIPQFHGETGGASLRTGRAMETSTSFSLDPRIQELQLIAQYEFRAINEQSMAVAEGYWPRRRFWCFSGMSQDDEVVEFEPAKHMQTGDGGRKHSVRYPFAGADAEATSLNVMQGVGAGLLSTKDAMRKVPWVEDADQTERQIELERFRQAVGVGFAQQITGGQVLAQDGITVIREMQRGASMEDAIEAAQRQAQEREAEQQQAREQEPGGADAQPGLQPGADAEQALQDQQQAGQMLAQVPPATTSQDRLRQLFSAMRGRA